MQLLAKRTMVAYQRIVLLVLTISTIAVADVRATLSQPDVVLGESFTLQIQADGNTVQVHRRISPRYRRTSKSRVPASHPRRASETAGCRPASGGRSDLLQKEIGTLTIPPISVGDQASNPLTIEVLDPANVPRAEP